MGVRLGDAIRLPNLRGGKTKEEAILTSDSLTKTVSIRSSTPSKLHSAFSRMINAAKCTKTLSGRITQKNQRKEMYELYQ